MVEALFSLYPPKDYLWQDAHDCVEGNPPELLWLAGDPLALKKIYDLATLVLPSTSRSIKNVTAAVAQMIDLIKAAFIVAISFSLSFKKALKKG